VFITRELERTGAKRRAREGIFASAWKLHLAATTIEVDREPEDTAIQRDTWTHERALACSNARRTSLNGVMGKELGEQGLARIALRLRAKHDDCATPEFALSDKREARHLFAGERTNHFCIQMIGTECVTPAAEWRRRTLEFALRARASDRANASIAPRPASVGTACSSVRVPVSGPQIQMPPFSTKALTRSRNASLT
jgi:hypothetical protein